MSVESVAGLALIATVRAYRYLWRYLQALEAVSLHEVTAGSRDSRFTKTERLWPDRLSNCRAGKGPRDRARQSVQLARNSRRKLLYEGHRG